MPKTMNKKKEFLKMLKCLNELNQEAIDSFINEMKENPFKALEWSRGVFQCSAELRANNYVISALGENKDLTLKEVEDYLQKQVLDDARWTHNSSSIPSNLIARELDCAYAKLYERIKGFNEAYKDK